jgi:predicted acylesterase/phospholipase RssA
MNICSENKETKSKKPPFIALYNYGGGLRGLIPAYIMSEIEERTGLRMAEMVDIFCGPSTGSILNSALNVRNPDKPDRPKYRARHLVRYYLREGHNIFPPDRFRQLRGIIHDFNNRTMKIGQLNKIMRRGHYDVSHLKKSLRELFGDTKMAHSLSGLIIPFYNIAGKSLSAIKEADESDASPVHTRNSLDMSFTAGKAVWLRHLQPHKDAPTPPPPAISMKNAVLASCAAPSYFPCHDFFMRDSLSGELQEYHGIDGSIFDNPCISYHGAIRRHVPDGYEFHMIGLGTGVPTRPITKEKWNELGALGVVDPSNDLPLINILFQAAESALIDSFGEDLGERLYIINQSLYSDTPDDPRYPFSSIDDATPENMERMKSFAYMMMENYAKEMDDICHLLVSNRDRRRKDKRYYFEGLGE